MRGNYPLACFPAAGEKRALTYRMGRIRPEPPLERCPGERGGSIQEQPRPRQLPPAPPPPPAPGCSDPALCLPGARPGGLPQPARAPPSLGLQTRDQPSRDGLAPGRGDPRRWGPNRGSRLRPNPRDSIKKLARAAGGEAKPGDLYYEDRLFKTARLAARPRSRRPRGPGCPGRSPGSGRGAAPGLRGPAESGPGSGPRLSAERGSNLPPEKRLIPGHLPPLISFLRPPSSARCSKRAPAMHIVSTLKASIIAPRAGRVPIVARIAFDVLYLMPLQAKRQANTECPVTRDLITAECILHAD